MILFACIWMVIQALIPAHASPNPSSTQGTSPAQPAGKSSTVYPELLPAIVYGEVVDVWCYCSRSVGIGRGEDHKKCAQTCAAGGAALGILDDHGKLYIAAKSGGFKGANDLLMPYVAKRVRVQGWYAHRGGAEVLNIDKVKLAKDVQASTPPPGLHQPAKL